MRYLICAALALTACRRQNAAREAQSADPTPSPPAAAAPTPAQDTAAFAARLVGRWNGEGVDSGATRPQRFTLTWSRDSAGALVGEIAFRPGEKYRVKVVSMSDSTVVYESEPHRSPTLKADVVTHTEARLSADSLTGTYEARATAGGKVLRGRFGAARAR
jgi:hypothetical protein